MLAQGRGIEVFQGARMIAAAMNPTATARNGFSAENQIGFVFILFISSN